MEEGRAVLFVCVLIFSTFTGIVKPLSGQVNVNKSVDKGQMKFLFGLFCDIHQTKDSFFCY